MGTHFENPLLRPFKRLVRRKKKRLSRAEADAALAELGTFLRSNVGLDMHPMQSDRASAPARSVIRRVQGSSKAHPDTFVGGGAQTACRYMRLLDASGFSLSTARSMLDFGIGTGRVSVHFLPFDLERHGCDVNEVAVEWCRERFGDLAEIRHTDLAPPLPYADASFDLVLATSVFTHTPHASYRPWIEEFRRILRPGGAIAATVHDFARAEALAPDSGWLETGRKRGLHINTYLTRSHFDELWADGWELHAVDQDPPNQTFFVARVAA